MADPAQGAAASAPTAPAGWPLVGRDGAPEPLSADHLAAYLAFIGEGQPSAPTLDALASLQRAHLRAIPFENLSPMLGEPVSLAPDDLVAKLLSSTRGGYCFEHNMLFAGVLRALGYGVELHAGRALIGLLPGEVRPRTHLALLVTPADSSDPVLTDVGFGRTTLNGPLRLDLDVEQPLAGDRYRLADHDGEWVVESARWLDGEWRSLYLLDPRPVYPVDVEMANHFVATHPDSHMKRSLILLRAGEAGKRSFTMGELTVDEAGRQEHRAVSGGELAGVLRDEFGIEPPTPVDHLLG